MPQMNIEASNEELGEIAGAMGLEISAPQPTPEEQQTAETMVQQSEDQNTSMVGDPSEPIAGVGKAASQLTTWLMRKAMKEIPATSVEPKEAGRTDLTLRLQHDSTLNEAREGTPIPPLQDEVQAVESSLSNAELAERVNRAEIGNYDQDDIHVPNFNTYSSDEIAATVGELSEINKDAILKQKREVVHDEELYNAAELLRTKPEFITEMLGLEPGTTLPDAKILAFRQTLELLFADLNTMAKNYNTLDDNGKMKFTKVKNAITQLFPNYMGARAESGRSIRAIGLPTNVGGEDTNIDQVYSMMQQEAYGLTDEIIAHSIAIADDSYQTAAVADALFPKLYERTFDTAYEIFINGILSGLKTHMVNFVGSTLRIGVDVLDTMVAARMGKLDASPMDAIHVNEYKAKLASLMTGYAEAWEIAMRSFIQAERYGNVDKLDDAVYDRFIKAESYGVDNDVTLGKAINALGAVINFPTERLMGGTDAFNKKMAERASLSAQAYRRAANIADENNLPRAEAIALYKDLVENPTEEMKVIAKNEGLFATFQEPLGEWGTKAQRVIQGNRALKTIIPFFKTPTNLMKQGFLERTPFGLLSTQYRKDMMAGGARGQMARAKLVTGTMMSVGMYNLALSGKITGNYSRDKDVKKAQMAAGWQPRSFVIEQADGSVDYISFDRLEPFSYLGGMAADIAQLNKEFEYSPLDEQDEKRYDRLVSSFTMAIAENTLNKTFMRGAYDFMSMATEGEEYKISRWLQNMGNSFTPYSGLRRDIGNVDDPTLRRSEDFAEYWSDQVGVFYKESAPIVDIQGREIKRKHILSPWGSVKQSKDVLDREVLRLAEETRTSAVRGVVPRISGVSLTKHQQARLAKYSRGELQIGGQTFSERMKETIQSEEYRALFADDQVKILRSITQKYDEVGRAWLLENDKELSDKVRNKTLTPFAERQAYEKGTEVVDELNALIEEVRMLD